MDYQPLVSIIIITYNSAEFVVETLDSALAQTYPNIEIIVTDDCSTDNTVEVCKGWMEQYQYSGVRMEIIKAEKNTGTAGNCNRGLNVAQGKWIKLIAGDDILLPDAIESYYEYVSEAKGDVDVVFGKLSIFSGRSSDRTVEQCEPKYKKIFYLDPKITAKKQYSILSHTFVGSGPTFFCKTAVLKSLGGYDTRFYLQEDWPMFIKLAKNGHRFYLLDKVVVLWRKNENSVTHSKGGKSVLFGSHRIRMVKEYKYEYLNEELNTIWRRLLQFSLWMQNKVIDTGNSYNNKKSVFYFYLYRALDPFIWYSRTLSMRDRLINIK